MSDIQASQHHKPFEQRFGELMLRDDKIREARDKLAAQLQALDEEREQLRIEKLAVLEEFKAVLKKHGNGKSK